MRNARKAGAAVCAALACLLVAGGCMIARVEEPGRSRTRVGFIWSSNEVLEDVDPDEVDADCAAAPCRGE